MNLLILFAVTVIATVVALLLFPAASQPKAKLAPVETGFQPERYEGQIGKITRGETVFVLRDGRAERLKLFGISRVESGHRFASEAHKILKEEVIGLQVEVQTISTDDKGEILAELFLDDQSINAVIIEAGLVRYDAQKAPDRQDLADAEQLAIKTQTGLWNPM